MDEYALVKNEVRKVIRKEHFGDSTLWLTLVLKKDVFGRELVRWVPAKDCTPLDPALNILFERKEDGQTKCD